jgi:hypothetical protein
MPGETTTESLKSVFQDVPVGSYKLAIALFADPKAAVPAYRLGIQGRTATGWYVLCDKVQVLP